MAAQSRLWSHKLDADTTVLVVMASWRDFAFARTAEPVPMIHRHPINPLLGSGDGDSNRQGLTRVPLAPLPERLQPVDWIEPLKESL